MPGQRRHKRVIENYTEIAGLNGTNVNKIFDNLDEILDLFHLERHDEILENWHLWATIRQRLKKNKDEIDLDQLQADLDRFIMRFINIYEYGKLTPYLHIVVCHSVQMLKRFHSLSLYSQQGFEAAHKFQKMIWERATSRGGGGYSSIKQTMEYFYRHFFMKLKKEYNIEINQDTL